MPRTEAGKWLESEEPYLTTWAWGGLGTPIIEAIEREAAMLDRDRLARALHHADDCWPECGVPTGPLYYRQADAIIAALEAQE